MAKIVQTAGRNALGEFAPEFAHFNDDVLFGENWNNNDIDVKTRSIITVVALMAQGITDSSLKFHLQNAKDHGVSQKEIAAVITHVGFYAGWPKAGQSLILQKRFGMRTKQRNNLAETARHERVAQNTDVYAVKARNYKGLRRGSPVFCRNNWHIHHAKSGGGQILVCVGGRGYYQEEGKPAVEMNPGDCINIPAEVKHWHGAAPDSWFSHLAIEVPGEETSNEWCEPVTDEEYGKLQ